MFTVEQNYDLAALTVLCRALRKSVRRAWNAVRIVVWVVFLFGAAVFVWGLALRGYEPGEWKLPLSLAVLLTFLLLGDRLNGWIALRQMAPGTARSTTVFTDDSYTVKAEKAETCWQYDNITTLCESERYFIFFLGKRHGQLFDKQGFQTGDPDAFRAWIERKTGKTFQKIK